MNNLNKAADLLRNGWCTGKYKDGDKFCALGAIAAIYDDSLRTVKGPVHFVEDQFSEVPFDDIPEIRTVAQVIIEQHPERFEDFENHSAEDLWHYFIPSQIVFEFNDDQETVEPVIAMLEKAAVKLDEQI